VFYGHLEDYLEALMHTFQCFICIIKSLYYLFPSLIWGCDAQNPRLMVFKVIRFITHWRSVGTERCLEPEVL
jgi:hypothetical protein